MPVCRRFPLRSLRHKQSRAAGLLAQSTRHAATAKRAGSLGTPPVSVSATPAATRPIPGTIGPQSRRSDRSRGGFSNPQECQRQSFGRDRPRRQYIATARNCSNLAARRDARRIGQVIAGENKSLLPPSTSFRKLPPYITDLRPSFSPSKDRNVLACDNAIWLSG